MSVDYENVGRFTINNSCVLDIWDHLVAWLKEKSVRGAVAFELGAGGHSPHLDITVEFKPMSYKIQSANLREVLRRKVKSEKWSIKKHAVKPPTHRYELLVGGYARKEQGNPECRYVEWGNEDLDLGLAEAEYKERVRQKKLIVVHSQNWWAICIAYGKEYEERIGMKVTLRDVLQDMFRSRHYDMKYMLKKLTRHHELLYDRVLHGNTLSDEDVNIFFSDF